MVAHRFVHGTGMLALVSVLCLTGCNLLRFNIFPNQPVPAEGPEKDTTPGIPSTHSLRVSQFVFYSDFELKKDAPLFRELSQLRDQVHKELQLPPSTTLVQVHLFEDKEKYERFMQLKFPDLPKRRAFFVAMPRRMGGNEDLYVYTYWGDRVQQDLRHELTHALLHASCKDVPLWLDEGLAEYFELPAAAAGVNQSHLDYLCRGPTGPNKVDLERLEQMTKVEQMTPAEYRESWAWTHLMLRTTPQARATLIAYLAELRTNPRPGPLKPRLARVFLSPDETLQKHLTEIDRVRSASAK
ncbi:MAG: DUF1570 domain-containing protein [Gemmataceae bacterium]